MPPDDSLVPVAPVFAPVVFAPAPEPPAGVLVVPDALSLVPEPDVLPPEL